MDAHVSQWLTSPLFWVALIPIGFLTLLFCVALFERRLVRPYIRLDDPAAILATAQPDQLPDPSQASPYVASMSRELADAGFEFGGFVTHAKLPRIRILAAVWWTPQRDVLALTGSGTVMNMAAYQTWLITPLSDGRFLITTDHNDEGDPSGLYVISRMLNMPIPVLLEKHRKRMEKFASLIEPFIEPTAMDALMMMYMQRVESMVERGIARWGDDDHAAWHYSVKGALLVCVGFVGQLTDALRQIWRANREPIASTHLMPIGTNLLNLPESAGDSSTAARA